MNHSKYIFPLIALFIVACSFPLHGQTQFKDQQQLRLHVRQNGKIQFVDFALTKTYFSRATMPAAESKSPVQEEFTAKGSESDGFEAYAYFLSKNGIVKSFSENGDFTGQSSGIYTLYGFSYPSGISPETFIGQPVETIEAHPMFRKDPDVYRLTVTLIVPESETPVAMETRPLAEPKAAPAREEISAALGKSN